MSVGIHDQIPEQNPMIFLKSGKIYHVSQAVPCTVILKENVIYVACTSVEPEAIRFVLAKYDEWMNSKKTKLVLQ